VQPWVARAVDRSIRVGTRVRGAGTSDSDAPGSAGTRATGEHGDVGAWTERESCRWDDRVGVRGVRDVGRVWARKDDDDDGDGGDDDVREGVSRTKDGDGLFFLVDVDVGKVVVERWWYGDEGERRGKGVERRIVV
jgi:hypothetical protein